ncbi:MAG TPA: phosphotransferase [Solirubrobacteraceae bacterium]|jgi:aminoglycoside/choline kinase family phosphotransferase|nr:phosphotransferase [Solirubrobacteraceae bacterium]
MTEIANTIDELTADWFTSALREGGTIPPSAAVASATSSLIGTGQLGLVARSELDYDGECAGAPRTFVVKLPSADAGSRGMGAAMGVYESEVRFYQEIAPLLHAAIPRMHWGDVDPASGRFTLVIDDLSQTADVGDMVGGGTVAQAEIAIAQLAALQAPIWNDPCLTDKAWLSIDKTEMLFGAVAPAFELFAERFGERVSAEHLELARGLVPKAAGSARRLWQPPYVVAHGDYRLDNMMFGRGPGAPPLAVIDWQAARLGPPLLDAAIYLGSCLTAPERREHEERLLRIYHERLRAAGIDDFSWDDVLNSYRVSSLYPFLLTIAVSVTLERTERGDQMWAQMFTASAGIAADTDAAALLA